jgi:hypothetical protein
MALLLSMPFIELFKRHIRSGTVRIISPIVAAMAMVSTFSAGARSQVVQPMYGVPVTPIVKYGPPPTPTLTPTPVISTGQQSLEALIVAIITAAVFLICLWAGLKYYLNKRE